MTDFNSHSIPCRRATVLLAVALGVSASACNDGEQSGGASVVTDTLPGGAVRTLSTSPSDSGRWSLELLHEIQPPEGDAGELLQPNDVALTDDGTVLVAEQGSAHVKVFGADGAYLRTIGASGEGPGEFRVAWIAARADTLFVQDPQVARGSAFLVSSGEYLMSRPTACCYWMPIGIDGRGRAVLPMMRVEADSLTVPSMSFIRTALTSTQTDTVHVPYRRAPDQEGASWVVREGDAMRMSIRVPLQPLDAQVADPRGDGFVTGWSGEYLFRVSRDGRDTAALYGRAHEAVSVTGAEKQAMVDDRIRSMTSSPGPRSVPEAVLRDAFDVNLIPDVRPAFETFHVDPFGRTWVRTWSPDSAVVTYDLFGEDRVWLDVVQVDAALWPTEPWASIGWGKNRVVVPGEDEDGRPVVRVFGIVKR